MKKFFKKNKGLVISSIVASLVLVAALFAVKGRQIFAPSAANQLGMHQVFVGGAVSIEGTNSLNENRFTKLTCPNKPFITDKEMDASVMYLGKRYIADWDCEYPNFFFKFDKAPSLDFVFNLTPPKGYRCVRSYVYLNDELTGESSSSCNLKVNLSKSGNYFIWFRVTK